MITPGKYEEEKQSSNSVIKINYDNIKIDALPFVITNHIPDNETMRLDSIFSSMEETDIPRGKSLFGK
jgi:hypothetical protein